MRKNDCISLDLTELDVQIILESLALKQMRQMDINQSTKAVDILIERIYRALGVRFDK